MRQVEIDNKITEIKEQYKDNPNDKNYFICKLAMSEWNNYANYKYIMSHVNEKEIMEQERKLRLEDVTDVAINHAKEQSWIHKGGVE